ncbi:SDR family oxidoreductase [Virgibacillus sp. NKC19-3]|uniref:SDR family oxidoreductase n=1 Tax=Virgibacillus saliphilus TaxID=2831674 RepID=UPI001C9B0826|nr:SDR family oxidoreductase [Virgibacillus sp. NKC19-3]MBY7145111.1 SDR family oxidoreductase [Virgibacillus sp. NKC19-3]
MKLANKKVVIIGGSSGIGLETAKLAVEQNAEVIIAGRSEDKLQQAKSEIGSNVTTHTLDFTKEKEVQAFFDKIGKLDSLVVTAGIATYGNFLEVDTSQDRDLFEGKFWGQYHVAKYAAPNLAEDGSITLFSGVVAYKAMEGASALSAVNAAVSGLGQTLALELAPVRVNVVSPGVIDTPSRYGMPEDERKAFYDAVGGQLPMKRVGQPEDVAESVIYLLRNGFSTGEVLHVEGGHRLI